MKNILLAILIIVFIQSNVYGCIRTVEIEDGSVTIEPDDDPSSGMYHVRAPAEYEGASLNFLILSAHDGKNEISVPLSIRSKAGVTGSHFHMSSKWVNVRVAASYEGKKCSELIAKLSM